MAKFVYTCNRCKQTELLAKEDDSQFHNCISALAKKVAYLEEIVQQISFGPAAEDE